MTQQSNKPVHTIRLGNIRATIWQNERESNIRHSVTICRGYKEGETWKDTQSFNRDDLPRVVRCADLAYQWIFDAGNNAFTDTQTAQPDGEY